MLTYLRDKWRSLQLKARYQRLVQEQVLEMMEGRGPAIVPEDPGQWMPMGQGKSAYSEINRPQLRDIARQLIQTNPYARNLLRLLEVYVAGPGFAVTAAAGTDRTAQDILRQCDHYWKQFLTANRRHFSFHEAARRTWRDGECFLRMFPATQWPPVVRFVDPELIDSPSSSSGSQLQQGIWRDWQDVETVLGYQLIDPQTQEPLEMIPAAEMLHLKINADTNEPRGLTLFAPIYESLASFDKWLETELQARKLQSSIVLWRKVHGSPGQITSTVDAAQMQTPGDTSGNHRRERYRPGTILTTSHSTDLQFLSPNTNFGDAVPLGRLMLLSIAAGAGVPEFMLTSDASNSNFASTMIAEGPAVKMFEHEQRFFAGELDALWRWVMQQAVEHRLLPAEVLDDVEPRWTFPQLVNRDRSQDRATDIQLVSAGVLSRAEVARRDDVDFDVMQAEMARELGTVSTDVMNSH